jgi:hypothetical protein
VAPVPARWEDAEPGLGLVVLRGEHDIARRGGWFPTVAPSSVGETPSWLEGSLSMLL